MQKMTGKDRGQLWKMKSKEGKVTSLPEDSKHCEQTCRDTHLPSIL